MDDRPRNPCPRTWSSLSPSGGEDRRRHCDTCGLDVLDVARMSRRELEGIEGELRARRVCVFLTRRGDGSLVVRDAAADRAWSVLRRLAARAAGIGIALGTAFGCSRGDAPSTPPPDAPPPKVEELPEDLLRQLQALGYIAPSPSDRGAGR